MRTQSIRTSFLAWKIAASSAAGSRASSAVWSISSTSCSRFTSTNSSRAFDTVWEAEHYVRSAAGRASALTLAARVVCLCARLGPQ